MSSASKKRKSDEEEDTAEEDEGKKEKKKSKKDKKDKKKKEKHFWKGWPTKLIRKVTLVKEAEDRLPVHTLTFEIPTPTTTSSTSPTSSEDKMIPHTSVRMELGDVVKMVIPGYKPKSYSMCRKTDQEFDVTLKVYPDGRASGFLDRLVVGDTVGSFGLRKNKQHNPGTYVGIICFGVGITEGLPVARAQLLEDGTTKVVLLWASRTTADTFWKDPIQQLQEQYPNKFQIVHILSREEKEECLHGRINPQILGQVFQPDDKTQARFLSVGTKEMMKQTDQMLLQLGYTFPQNLLLPKQQDTKEVGKEEED